MGPIEKNVMFGTKQEAVLMPNEGYEIESVVVLNKSTNEIVPSQLTKTGDNPAKWICAFVQPAGVVAIKPSVKPIYYTVVIEACEHCNIVLLESNDIVNVQIAAVSDPDTPDGGAKEPDGAEEPNTAEEAEREAVDPLPDEEAPGADAVAPDALNGGKPAENENRRGDIQSDGQERGAEGQGPSVNFNYPQHSSDIASGVDEGSNVEDDLEKPELESESPGEFQSEPQVDHCLQRSPDVEPELELEAEPELVPEMEPAPEPEAEPVPELNPESEVEDAEETIKDCVYSAGEFEADLQDKQPREIYPAEYNKKNELYWRYKNALRAGQITQAEFDEVERKHMDFMNDISEGNIVVVE